MESRGLFSGKIRKTLQNIIGIKHVFSMHVHSPGPVGGVENRGQRSRFSTPPKGPG